MFTRRVIRTNGNNFENVNYSVNDIINAVSIEDANKLIMIKKEKSKTNAFATLLFITSPLSFLVLNAIAESNYYTISENTASGIGIIILFLAITFATLLLMSSNAKTASFDYLEKYEINLEYGVKGIVEEKKKRFEPIYNKCNRIGTALCIISVIPLFAGSIINDTNEMLQILMLSMLLILVGIGVYFFVYAGSIWDSYNMLLQLEEYTVDKKMRSSITVPISIIYWLVVFASIVMYSILTGQRKESGVFLIIGAILYPALLTLINLLQSKKNH